MEKILKTIFKPQCVFCGKLGDSFCKKCISKCSKIDVPRCIICHESSVDGNTHMKCKKEFSPHTIFSAFEYGGHIRDCIKRSKFEPYEFNCLSDLAVASVSYSWRVGCFYEDCIVVSVPLSVRRKKERGFNQVDIISKKLSKFYKLRFVEQGVKRVIPTKFLSEMTREERKLILEEAFVADPKIFKDKDVLLVDDICTTGTTLISCSKALKQAGARKISCFTIARVL